MISIIIPIYNEEETIPELHSRLTKVFDTTEEEFEAIFINDGSIDASMELIKGIHNSDNRYKAVFFHVILDIKQPSQQD